MKYPMQVLSRPNRTLKSYDAKGISKFSRHTGKCIQGSVRTSRGKTYIEVTVVKSLTVSSEQPIVQPQTVQDVCLGPVTRASANRKDWYRNCLSFLIIIISKSGVLAIISIISFQIKSITVTVIIRSGNTAFVIIFSINLIVNINIFILIIIRFIIIVFNISEVPRPK